MGSWEVPPHTCAEGVVMEPRHERLDPLAYLVEELGRLVDHPVVTTADAALDPSYGPVTVVQVTSNTPAGRLTRWSFKVSVTMMTYADDPVTAFNAHVAVADAILELATVDGGDVLVSSVLAVQEPEDIPVRSATDWPGQLSRYTMYLRRKG